MSEKTYSEKLLDSRWLIVRDRILLRDNNMCQICGSTNNLHVHHKYYVEGKEPWDCDERTLITLCNLCHQVQHSKEPEDLLKLRLSNLANEYVFGFTKSVLELHPLFINQYNSLKPEDKKHAIEFFYRCLINISLIPKDKYDGEKLSRFFYEVRSNLLRENNTPFDTF